MSECISKTPLSRRELNRQDRREAILAVAGQSFLTNGYAGTSMSAIAATLGGSKATLWSYFPSKVELFEAVLDHATAAYRAQLTLLLDPCGDLGATIERFGVSFLTKVTSPQAIALHRLVHAEAGRAPEVGEIFYQRAPRRTHGLLADFLAQAMERGLLRQDDPLLAARALVALCMSGCHQQLLIGRIGEASEADIAGDAARATAIFLRAYAPSGD